MRLYFTKKLPFAKDNQGRLVEKEDIWYADLVDTTWQNVTNVGPPLNTPNLNEGAQCISADGFYMFFTSNFLKFRI